MPVWQHTATWHSARRVLLCAASCLAVRNVLHRGGKVVWILLVTIGHQHLKQSCQDLSIAHVQVALPAQCGGRHCLAVRVSPLTLVMPNAQVA
jgi:hypothetical protein